MYIIVLNISTYFLYFEHIGDAMLKRYEQFECKPMCDKSLKVEIVLALALIIFLYSGLVPVVLG